MTDLGIQHLGLFIATGILLNLTPGPDVLYIVGHAMRRGLHAGFAASLGIAAGCCVHVAAAALGVGALIAASATAFTVLKWAGAAYLVWMGLRALFARATPIAIENVAARAVPERLGGQFAFKTVFLGGFGTNVLNPKVAVFFLAFVPQFIAPGAPQPALAFGLLGLLFVANGLLVCVGWALAGAWLARRPAVQRGLGVLDRIAGLLFIGFGVRLAVSELPR